MEIIDARRSAVERVRKEFENSKSTRTWTGYVNARRLISQVVFSRSSGFILELQQKKPMLHPEILSGAKDDAERESLKGFLMSYAGVQRLDTKTVCKEALLPKILTSARQPQIDELVDFTVYCQRHPNADIARGSEVWVATKSGHIRPAREVYFSAEFRPSQSWEANRKYVSGLDFFISPKYVAACTKDEEFKAWREFFRVVGVKESPHNGVEDFAMNFAMERLQALFGNVEPVDKRNFGYDLKALDGQGGIVHIEVKGLSSDADVELTGNEAEAASIHRDRFYLCVVSGIPNLPVIRLVQNPASIGQRDKLTIRQADWQAGLPIQ